MIQEGTALATPLHQKQGEKKPRLLEDLLERKIKKLGNLTMLWQFVNYQSEGLQISRRGFFVSLF